MRRIVRSGLLGLVLVLAVGAFVGCGDGDDAGATRPRGAMPFVHIKLRNKSLPDGRPATARAVGTQAGHPSQDHQVGPVPPEAEETSQPPGTGESDAVSITVIFEGGPTFQGEGSYPGSYISTVDVECGEPDGGIATVNFDGGRPPETIPLHP